MSVKRRIPPTDLVVEPIEVSLCLKDRADRSIIDHIHIIEALEVRDTDLVERLVREHTLNLAQHVERHVDYLT